MKDAAINWPLAILCSVLLGCSYQLDGPEQRTQADTELRAQRIEDQIAASHTADYEQCKADHGENVGVAYLPDGSHRCTLKNGRAIRNQIVVARRMP